MLERVKQNASFLTVFGLVLAVHLVNALAQMLGLP